MICFPIFGFEEKNITVRGTLNNARIAIESGEPVTVAFMGG